MQTVQTKLANEYCEVVIELGCWFHSERFFFGLPYVKYYILLAMVMIFKNGYIQLVDKICKKIIDRII